MVRKWAIPILIAVWIVGWEPFAFLVSLPAPLRGTFAGLGILALLGLPSVVLFQTAVALATAPDERRHRLAVLDSDHGRQGGW